MQTLKKSSTLRGVSVPQERRSVEKLLAALDKIAEQSPRFISRSPGQFRDAERSITLPRYIYLGPKGGGDVVRIGIFATIHGDEPEGALAVTRLIEELEKIPEIAQGYALYLYPVCNPTGFEDGTRHSRSGMDLNREFWRDSAQPEIRFLESEICLHAFDGIITLHCDDTSDGLYGFVSGSVLSENLLEPALCEAEKFLPRNKGRLIDGFEARDGIITTGYVGVLKALPDIVRPPFEITFETPQRAPVHLQVEAFTAALKTMLVEYRYLISIAQNI
jgi:murein peptide amidase A